jgi:hypothetical protein
MFHHANSEKKRWTDLPQDPDLNDDLESLAAVPVAMPGEPLPQKNTFVHFQDEELQILYPNRSVTCPGSISGIGKDSDLDLLERDTDLSEDNGHTLSESETDDDPEDEHNLIEQKLSTMTASRRWEDISEDEETPVTPATLPIEGKKKWADLSDEEQTPVHHKATLPVEGKKRWADLSEEEQTPVHHKAQGRKRWVDLSEDEKTPAHQPNEKANPAQTSSLDDQSMIDDESPVAAPAANISWEDVPGSKEDVPASMESSEELGSTSSSPLSQDKEPNVVEPSKRPRPQFAKPTREARTRQFQAKLDECFGLDFDEVDPSQQDGLTHRMLVGLKSLGELVNFWQPDGTQVSEEGFKLLCLEEADMYALGRIIRKADKLLEERRFREAYDCLCKSRRWFDPDTLMEERAKAAAHAEKKEKKDKKDSKKKVCDSDADDDDWVQVKKKDKKKSSDEAQKTQQAHSNISARTLNPKSQVSNLKPQTSTLRPRAPGFKPQSSQGRKAPEKLLCRYNICIEQDKAFNVVRKLLGERGSHMKSIAENTGAKLRIRGRGSGFLEGPDQKEASDEPLMLCISAATREGFDNAVEDVESLLIYVHGQYREFCQERKKPAPRLSVVQRGQPTH